MLPVLARVPARGYAHRSVSLPYRVASRNASYVYRSVPAWAMLEA
jgi:hypothetical protein